MVRLTSGPPPDNEFARHAERLFKGYGETELLSGAVLVPRGDRVLFRKAAVLANADFQVWNTVEIRFGIAAITHLFIVAAILRLQGEGRLHADLTQRTLRAGQTPVIAHVDDVTPRLALASALLVSSGVVLSIAIGIGPMTTVFAWTEHPVRHPLPAGRWIDQLVSVVVRDDRVFRPDYVDWQFARKTLGGLAAFGVR